MKKHTFADFLLENIVTIIFVLLIIAGFILPALTGGDTINPKIFLDDLSNRMYRNAFLVLALIIPVVAGLGLNFGIVVGAIAGQLAILWVRYLQLGNVWGFQNISGFTAFMLCILISTPIAILIGWLVGMLYNKTRGQEMIASLIVGYFGNGVYQFIVLFLVGAVIPVTKGHPMILPDGIGIRMSVEMGNIKYALEDILQVPFHKFMVVCGLVLMVWLILNRFVIKPKPGKSRMSLVKFIALMLILAVIVGIFAYYWGMEVKYLNDPAIGSKGLKKALNKLFLGNLCNVKKVPIATLIMIALLALFTKWILTTKLGQDFRACGQNQHIAASNGIDVDKTRIIATIISTVLAAWGQVLYLQNTGTMSVYTAHNQIGFFAVAAILVGGASVNKATISQALLGTLLFQTMTILSPDFGKAVFGQPAAGEYFRTFMVYGVIGLALGLYVWKANKAKKLKLDPVVDTAKKE